MTESNVDILLVGGGVASAAAAAELRKQGFDGSITLVTRELLGPYHRPPITKALLGPDADAHDIAVHPEGWWEDSDVRLLTRSAVVALDTAGRTATLANKSVLHFQRALLATGAMVRRLNVDGAALEGIHYLRAPGNAQKLRSHAAHARRAVLVGGSFIATEVAASLTAFGVHCTMVMPERAPLETAFGATVADHVSGLLRSRGVELVCGEQVAAFSGEGQVDGVRTISGRHIPTDLVVVGIGAVPDTKLAKAAGLTIGPTGGIACDATLRTSAEHVYAAGDACEYDSTVHRRRLRLEHEEHAIAQGVTAARNMLGAAVEHREIPYFWTDLAELARLEYVGPADEWDSERVAGSVGSGDFTVWYLQDDRVVAALTSGRKQDLDLARQLIATGLPDVAGE
ncbi:FAD-dependent oxidoreductase [Saccharopolyspora sp. NPDC050389]|uniref:NAD(P)/FAD-dependent oxidoreductase n=1 Tax=Saccharopolyspora sp. NPDC050389 TaxID=3155516 RepID=UPI0033C89E34